MSGAQPLYTREFARACAVHFTGAMSLAMFLLFPLYVKALGGTETTIGFVLGVGAAASVAARPVVGVVLDRIGRRRVLLWSGVANVASWIPFFFLRDTGVALYVWVVAHDVAWGALFAAYFTLAADLAPAARRAEGLAVFGAFGISSNGLAPWIGERVIEAGGFAPYLALAMAFGAASVLLTAGMPVVPRTVHEAPPSLRGLGRLARHPHLWRVLGATALLGIAINAAYLFVAPYTRVVGIERAGPFFAAYAATSVVIRLFGRRSLDALGAHRMSGPAFAAFAAGLSGLALLPSAGAWSTVVLVACGCACGAGHGTLFPVLSALAVNRGPSRRQGAVVGLQTAAIDAGAIFGTPALGVIADRFGYPVMYGTSALACVAGLVIMASDARFVRGGVG